MKEAIIDKVEALTEWAKEDKTNRAIIVIGYEKQEATPEGVPTETMLAMSGKERIFINALKAALAADNKRLANIVKEAVHELAMEEAADRIIKNLTKE